MRIEVKVDVENALNKLNTASVECGIEATFREEILRLEGIIKETAPVDTGRYRSAWVSIISGLEATLSNNVKYAKYLIFGTRKFKNVRNPEKYKKADIERGILHDVRAILHEWEAEFRKILERLA